MGSKEHEKKIVTIGDGTGLFTLLSGIKGVTSNATSIIALTPAFNSSRNLEALMDEQGALPSNGIIRCLVALSRDEKYWREIFETEYKDSTPLGTLMLSILEKKYGMIDSIKMLGAPMNLVGEVVPLTLTNSPEISSSICRHASEHIDSADAIVVGPGEISTIKGALRVPGVANYINSNSNARKIYVCNIMTKQGETDHYKARDFLMKVENSLKGKFDYVLLNTQRPSREALSRYHAEASEFVEPDLESTPTQKIIKKNLLSEKHYSRHHKDLLGQAIAEIVYSSR